MNTVNILNGYQATVQHSILHHYYNVDQNNQLINYIEVIFIQCIIITYMECLSYFGKCVLQRKCLLSTYRE